MTTPPAVDVGVPYSFIDTGQPIEPERRPSGRRSKLVIAVVLIAVFVGGMVFERLTVQTVPNPDEFALITDAWTLLHDQYVEADEMDPADLAHGAIAGMAYGVGDTGHTFFLTPEEAAYQAGVEMGSYGGIGIELDDVDGISTITSVVGGSPAAKAGLHVGDHILAVDGVSTTGPQGEAAVDSIGGAPGTGVRIKVEHPERDSIVEIPIFRAEIDLPAVEWLLVPGSHVALIRVYEFIEETGEDVSEAVRDAMDAGATGLVLDLRGNPGGLADQAVDVASLFLHRSDVILVERDADGVETKTKSSLGPVAPDLPLVVLVDEESASAAEVVMGALQDADRATVIGTTTAGTGTVMNAWVLDDESELWIGVTRWFTPDGRSAWHTGLTPDVVVEQPHRRRPIGPRELGELGVAGLAASGDAQLLRALEELE